MSDSPVFPRLVAVIDVSFPFVFHSAECAEREKAWAVRLFKLQVPVEKCLSTCLFTRAYVRACIYMHIRGCEYTLTAALLRLTSDRTTNATGKRETAIATWKSNRTIVQTRSLLVFLFIYLVVNFSPRIGFLFPSFPA